MHNRPRLCKNGDGEQEPEEFIAASEAVMANQAVPENWKLKYHQERGERSQDVAQLSKKQVGSK